MSHARIDTSVPRHPKFLRAGPAASWLWLAGVCYCQEALTDGFISTEAVYTLGVSRPVPLAAVLVHVGLWDIRDDGWQIHDYLDHNNSAAYIRTVRSDRKEAGRKGGRHKRSAASEAKQLASTVPKHVAKQTQNPTATPSTTVPVRTERTAAAPQRVFATNPTNLNPSTHIAVITALVTKAILPLRLADAQLVAATMAHCERLHIAYDAETVRKAIDSALFRYYRAARFRLEDELGHPIPDPRGIYHDHVRPRLKLARATLDSGTRERARARG